MASYISYKLYPWQRCIDLCYLFESLYDIIQCQKLCRTDLNKAMQLIEKARKLKRR